MIHDLDKTLEELLKQGLPADLASQVTITFATPDNEFSAQPPAIDLFLYDVRENWELRSNQWTIERQDDGTARKRRPPVRVDCSYLITAWSGDDSSSMADEHRLLGEVMTVLYRFRTLPAEVLQGSLQGQALSIPTAEMPVGTLQPGRMQSPGEFWQSLGGKPKAALNYTVTLALEPHEPGQPVHLVTEPILKLNHRDAGAPATGAPATGEDPLQ